MTAERQATDEDLREPLFDGLGDGAAMDPARRAALLERVVSARAAAMRRRPRILYLSGGVLAAAAAAVLAVLVLWPEDRVSIPPTEIFAYLLGPLTEMAAAGAITGAPPQENGLPTDAVVEAFWSDLEGPVAIGMDALEAPRALVSVEPTGPEASANHPVVRKEK
ncbi:MAG: hypothetical protein AMS14_05915 [Planctomycetes bacterium DG_20]|nr:MAG: hypothetical protein AMS14_05915 [Planctomycetes bacterium DG_20]